jgi:hypothetical protein
MEPMAPVVAYQHRLTERNSEMLAAMVLRSALSAFSTLFGSLGIFCFYFSFLIPALGAHAIVFLSTATGILLTSPK